MPLTPTNEPAPEIQIFESGDTPFDPHGLFAARTTALVFLRHFG